MNITVNDLDNNLALDQSAMSTLLGGGGWHTHRTSRRYSNFSKRVSIFRKRHGFKRVTDKYRTLTIVKKQHKQSIQCFRT